MEIEMANAGSFERKAGDGNALVDAVIAVNEKGTVSALSLGTSEFDLFVLFTALLTNVSTTDGQI